MWCSHLLMYAKIFLYASERERQRKAGFHNRKKITWYDGINNFCINNYCVSIVFKLFPFPRSIRIIIYLKHIIKFEHIDITSNDKLIFSFSIFKIQILRTLVFWSHCQVGMLLLGFFLAWRPLYSAVENIFVCCSGFIFSGVLLFSLWVWDGRTWRNCGICTNC